MSEDKDALIKRAREVLAEVRAEEVEVHYALGQAIAVAEVLLDALARERASPR